MQSGDSSENGPSGVHDAKASRQLADDRLWNADDVSRFLSISRSMVYKLQQTGELPSLRIGACVRFEPAVVRAFARGELRGRPEGGVVLLKPRGRR